MSNGSKHPDIDDILASIREIVNADEQGDTQPSKLVLTNEHRIGDRGGRSEGSSAAPLLLTTADPETMPDPRAEHAGTSLEARISRLQAALASEADTASTDNSETDESSIERPDEDPLSDPAAPAVDGDALRRMVAEVVREELRGALGERITRNVRKLVQREIMRAVATRKLD